MKKILLLPILLYSFIASAQNELSFSAGSGLLYYLGELNESKVFTNSAFLRPSANIGLSYKALPYMNVNLQFMGGSLYADDKYAITSNYYRNLQFKTSIEEFTLTAVFKPARAKKAIPYLSIGAGMFWFNPKGLYGTEWVALQPLGTEGQFINNGDYPKPYSLVQAVLPIGVGIEIKATDNIGFKFEAVFHKTFTDYLDDISSTYADSVSLAKTANGRIATAMAYKGISLAYPTDGAVRGNSGDKDSYVNITFSLLIYLRGSNDNGSGKSTFRFEPK